MNLNNLKRSFKILFLNEYPEDNNCYLVFNCPLEEVLKHLSPTLQDKIISIDYPLKNYSFTKEKAF